MYLLGCLDRYIDRYVFTFILGGWKEPPEPPLDPPQEIDPTIQHKAGCSCGAELRGRQGKMNSADHIRRAVLVFVIYVAAMIIVLVIRASIHSVERLKRKLKKKASLICYRERDENKTFKKISTK